MKAWGQMLVAEAGAEPYQFVLESWRLGQHSEVRATDRPEAGAFLKAGCKVAVASVPEAREV